jgi:hypothetical protein
MLYSPELKYLPGKSSKSPATARFYFLPFGCLSIPRGRKGKINNSLKEGFTSMVTVSGLPPVV